MKRSFQLFILSLLIALFISPGRVTAEEIINKVFLLEKAGSLLAFSGPRNNWFVKELRAGEKVIKTLHDGNVALAYTSDRALAFSGLTGRWSEERFRIHETVESISAEGNVATVITTIRALGFSAETGNWVESEFNISR